MIAIFNSIAVILGMVFFGAFALMLRAMNPAVRNLALIVFAGLLVTAFGLAYILPESKDDGQCHIYNGRWTNCFGSLLQYFD
jgi:predicted exporter